MSLTPKKVYAILKNQITNMEEQLSSPVRYKGTVATADLLPLNPSVGDMYNIKAESMYGEAGTNVAWNGLLWNTMGIAVDMSLYLSKKEAEATVGEIVDAYLEENPVSPGATKEQALQIEQNKEDILALKEDISKLDDVSPLTTDQIDEICKI